MTHIVCSLAHGGLFSVRGTLQEHLALRSIEQMIELVAGILSRIHALIKSMQQVHFISV